MKSFLVYSKKPLTKSIDIKDAFDIRFLKKGIRIAYLFDLTGIVYAIVNRLYLLGFIFLMLFLSTNVLLSIDQLAPYQYHIQYIKLSINVLLVIFGLEIEEFLLKRRKFKLEHFISANNTKSAKYALENQLSINLTSASSIFQYIKKNLLSLLKRNKI